MVRGRISRLSVRDVRFPTSLGGHGADAMHTDPDYSAAYVVIETDAEDGIKGCGITFTLGKGTEVDWSRKGRGAPGDSGRPKRGVGLVGQAGGKACLEVTCGHEILQKGQIGKKEREKQMLAQGYPAYTTSCAWLGYSDDTLKQLCAQALKDGWTRFKVKVGADLQDDMRRCQIIRDMIGPEKTLMMDANQRWDVPEAVEWMSKLAKFKPLWIEEPTSPDDILGHATISKALVPLGIGIATGEQCHNRVIFKQLLQAKALQFLQIDSCRLGSVNENLSVLLMAKKFEIPVCPHAGGVGLCELVQHLIIFDYISVSASLENRVCEYVDHLHEHFKYPVMIQRASYMPPKDPGYSTEMKEESVKKHQYPDGEVWKKLLPAQEN
ncbi:mitochondrial enolase superfamily member 1 isoform X8 [Homo sapiens]|uniref:mitochondrial enolase superfamily member 1 isoform X8 n=1 Tax=Homo sapiens TaxID=9606 RepID=UPI001FB0A767|nr:mitochondrial enolase superfamily member 1 isoform X8 [Homo sapiens]XP_054174767.1 mitochondrial enolase superfamily member 1 isoform X8 [Homo sapiens]